MDQGLLCILRAENLSELIQQHERWTEIAASLAVGIQYHDITGMTPDEAIHATLAAVEQFNVSQVAVELLSSLAHNGSEAVRIAGAILSTGVRLLVISYAAPFTPLIEVDAKMLKIIDSAFLDGTEDDLLFLTGYANHPVGLDDLLAHLKALEESLSTHNGDVPRHLIAADIRRIALLVRWIQRQPQNRISAN